MVTLLEAGLRALVSSAPADWLVSMATWFAEVLLHCHPVAVTTSGR